MKVKDLRERLIGAAEGNSDALALLEMLDQIGEVSVEEFGRAIKPALDKLIKKVASEKKKREAFNNDAIDRFLSELATTKEDNASFEAVVKRIEKDKALKIADAKELARKFLGELPKTKTKGDLLKAILQRQIEERRLKDRREHISDLF
ncbi:hypothetical protein [Hyphomicrobium sp.]|uniref:hypothetical protein n=1 Tax=Hyphomicrobium sp. TaxID=82 RepID=UPI001DD3A8FF|nr:hypothetical protein [Hyphomicrobium sp.]MBY0558788.1 hypothetical protein [Hyphomicrobium sp.]